jgi:hypothetical protein
MKRNLLVIFAALLILSSCSGYDPGISEAFMKYRLKERVTTVEVRGNDEDVTIFGKMDEDVIREMVILVGGDDNVLV